MDDLNPITRTERLLDGEDLTPTNREEMFIKRIYDKTQEIPEPVNRKEYFLKKAGEAGGDVTVVPLSVTDNGTYSEEGKAYSPVTVAVEPPEDSYQLKSITTPTSLATFNASAMPMPSLKVSVEAKQEGSGVPSPENVRPISGWSEVNVSDVGKNLLDLSGYTTKTANGITYTNNGDGTISMNGTSTASNWDVLTEVVLKAGTYILSGCPLNGSHATYHIAIQGDGVPWAQNEDTGNGVTVTIPNDGTFDIIFRIANSGISFNNVLLKPMIRLATETDPTFEPYINQTTTISLPQTVYGGEVDVVNGVLKLTHKIKVYSGDSNEGWYVDGTQSGSTYRMKASDVPSNIKLPSSNTDAMSAISNQFIATSADNIFLGNEGIGVPANGSYLTIYDSVYNTNDVSLWKTHLASNPMQVCYELAEPIIINLTPTLIKSLEGTNNLSVDCGEVIEGEYFKALGGE